MRKRYYLDGFVKGKLHGHDRLVDMMAALQSLELSDGFRWEQKYANTFDLRPSAHAYDRSVFDVLFSSSISTLIADVIGADLVMTHAQIRRSLPGPSYMDWHRDTYRYGNESVGNFPPVHKVIFYPSFGQASEPKLKLRVGSHRRTFDSRIDDLTGVHDLPYATYDSSDDEFILFDTSMMHGVIPDTRPAGSIRIIYSFLRRRQYEELLATNELHREQVEEYSRRLGNLWRLYV